MRDFYFQNIKFVWFKRMFKVSWYYFCLCLSTFLISGNDSLSQTSYPFVFISNKICPIPYQGWASFKRLFKEQKCFFRRYFLFYFVCYLKTIYSPSRILKFIHTNSLFCDELVPRLNFETVASSFRYFYSKTKKCRNIDRMLFLLPCTTTNCQWSLSREWSKCHAQPTVSESASWISIAFPQDPTPPRGCRWIGAPISRFATRFPDTGWPATRKRTPVVETKRNEMKDWADTLVTARLDQTNECSFAFPAPTNSRSLLITPILVWHVDCYRYQCFINVRLAKK